MRLVVFIILTFVSFETLAQFSDTITGFNSKIEGEEITYFSPRKKFADRALLTRANGKSSISWNAPLYYTEKLEDQDHTSTTYSFLLGFSSGTSSAERTFRLEFNGSLNVDIVTPLKKKGPFNLKGENGELSYEFVLEEYDQNGDAFGMLYVTLPAKYLMDISQFSLTGVDEGSRDWMMVFMYENEFKCDVSLTNLISKESKRQVSIDVDNPYPTGTELSVKSNYFNDKFKLKYGFNHLTFFTYDESFVGIDSIVLQVKDRIYDRIIEAKVVKPYTFHIIHHSHNDIGYSHLQTEVEEIQNQNIYSALRWIEKNTTKTIESKAIWHIESLWAVENFLRIASENDKTRFFNAIKSGNIVLSANYVNVLTGLCLNEELNWLLEYAKMNESNFGKIDMAMITDIPGITASGLRNYLRNDISYLSLGPNYVHAFPDHGDRVGGVINNQGDKTFYWKDHKNDKDSLLVWTAGKGYSFFHNIQEQEKKDKWEDRISAYCQELNDKNYPFEMVQLRYTKKSDNGPVDTNLCAFVENWNLLYKYPKLQISSVPTLFQEFEKKYGKEIATVTGEISPYWEDGAYSTAFEEANLRLLVKKTIALEQFLKKKKSIKKYTNELYKLHRNIVLFQEHTWGAWCSISDPEIPFTTEQWKYKKAFLDSAQFYYFHLEKLSGFVYNQKNTKRKKSTLISSFKVDPQHGGIVLFHKNDNPITSSDTLNLFEPLYSLGINPTSVNRAVFKSSKEISNTKEIMCMEVELSLPSIPNLKMIYTLYKNQGRVTCRFVFDKLEEKNKEALHFAFPFNSHTISYTSGERNLTITKDQLPGSNVDFICTEDQVKMINEKYKFTINSPAFNLFEIGTLIDETTINGVKVWNQNPTNLEVVYLYVLNNYWHTNYKAYQSGHFDFEVEVFIEKIKS
ncbi:MAG: hypothetical protein ACK479_13760 [Fluviicola sp.]